MNEIDLVTMDTDRDVGDPTSDVSTNVMASRNGDDEKRILRQRKHGSVFEIKPCQKRSSLQDMVRPLKRWLCENRRNPYPTRSQKLALGAESTMSLTQISNWFANARRRLKVTVPERNLSWSKRVKLYNSYAVGTAELFSDMSDLDSSDDEDFIQDSGMNTFEELRTEARNAPWDTIHAYNTQSSQLPQTTSGNGFFNMDNIRSAPKYKQTILQRYLNDTGYDQATAYDAATSSFNQSRARRISGASGSMGSRDYEEMSTSSGSHLDNIDDFDPIFRYRSSTEESDFHVKELDAAYALTSLSGYRQ